MGTYATLFVKDKTDTSIIAINKRLASLGYPTETFEGVLYGAFVSKSQLIEDVRFMNEDPEGLKQQPQVKRPITVKFLTSFFWNQVGSFCRKISASTDQEKRQWAIVFRYAHENPNLFDWKRSENCSKAMLRQYRINILN